MSLKNQKAGYYLVIFLTRLNSLKLVYLAFFQGVFNISLESIRSLRLHCASDPS